MNFLLRFTRDGLIVLVVVIILFEVALRVYPGLIPPKILLFYNEDLRTLIAERLDLPTEQASQELPRDDGGPPLLIYPPKTTIANRFEDIGSKEVTVDENGFCNSESMSYGSEKIELISIGDSFTFCTNVAPNESWTSRIHESLGLTAYNLGSPRKGLYEYLQILKVYGLEKNPDVVILAVYEGNDLRDAVNYIDFKEGRIVNENDDVSSCGASTSCKGFMYLRDSRAGRHSYAFNMLLATIRMSRGALYNKAAERNAIDFSYSVEGPQGTIVFNPNSSDTDEVVFARRLSENTVSLDLFENALFEFQKLSKERNFKPILVYIPSAYTAYLDELTFGNPDLYSVLTNYSEQQREYFKNKTDGLPVQFIDTTEALRSAAPEYQIKEKLLYFPHNVHLTPDGHSIVANSIIEAIRKEGMHATYERN